MPKVSITEYARLRNLDKGTVSRQVRKLQVPTTREGGQLLVDVDELDRRRAQYLNPLMARVVKSPAADPEMDRPVPGLAPAEGSADPGATAEADERRSHGPAVAGMAMPRPASGLVAQQELEKKLKNRRLLREIEREEGRLVPVALVVDEQQTRARKLRDRLMQGAAELASPLYALTTKPRTEAELRVWLQTQVRDLLERIAAEIDAERDEDEDTVPAGGDEDDGDEQPDEVDGDAAADPDDGAAEDGVGAPDGPPRLGEWPPA